MFIKCRNAGQNLWVFSDQAIAAQNTCKELWDTGNVILIDDLSVSARKETVEYTDIIKYQIFSSAKCAVHTALSSIVWFGEPAFNYLFKFLPLGITSTMRFRCSHWTILMFRQVRCFNNIVSQQKSHPIGVSCLCRLFYIDFWTSSNYTVWILILLFSIAESFLPKWIFL